MVRVQEECMYPKTVRELHQLKSSIMTWEEKWKLMIAELGQQERVPTLWKMAALLRMCPPAVREQTVLRMDGIGEDYEKLKSMIVSYAANKVERG